MAGLYACGAAVLTSLLRKETRIGLKRILATLEKTSQSILMIVAAVATSGIVIGIVTLTGLAVRLSTLLVDISGGSSFALLVLTALASIVLGMGIPVLPAYIMLAILVAPALATLGVLPLAAHLFIFYFAVLSFITPPVCPSVYVAAGIGGAPIMRTGLQSVRLGIVAYIVPFIFMYAPALLLRGSLGEILLAVVTSIVGVVALASGLEGWLVQRTSWLQRVLLIAGGIILIMPGWLTDVIGISTLGAVALWHWLSLRATRPVETGSDQ
jgi:TRAP-type uncharacterized transport system fused permease subunit